MSSTAVAFLVSFIALLGTPILAPIGARVIARQRSIVQRRTFQLILGGLAVVAAGLCFGVSTSVYEANAVLLGLAYLAFGVVAISAFRLRPRLLGFSLGAAASLLLLVSLLLGTVGALGVAFVVGDTVPIHSEFIKPTLKCYVTPFGNATTSVNGYNVEFKRPLPLLPVFEYSVGTERFDSPSFEAKEACTRSRMQESANPRIHLTVNGVLRPPSPSGDAFR